MTDNQMVVLVVGGGLVGFGGIFYVIHQHMKEAGKELKGAWEDTKKIVSDEWQRLPETERAEHKENLKQATHDFFSAILKPPPSTPSSTKSSPHTDYILTVGSVVVTYQFLGMKLHLHTVDDVPKINTRLSEILTANPKTDLLKIASSLGIKIVDVQGQPIPPPPPPKPRKDGFEI